MTSRRGAALAAGLGLLGGGAAWTVGPVLADAPATVDDTVPDGTDGDTVPDDETAPDGTDDDAATTDAGAGTTTEDTGADEAAADDAATDDGAPWIDDALAPLVEDGTLTQEQADAVATALDDAWPTHQAGRMGSWIGGMSIQLDTLTDTLGVTADELATSFGDGQSIADVARAQGVDVQTVIDALVAAASERIDEAVAAGALSETEAADRLETVTERITELVDEAGGPSLPGRPGAPGRGQAGPGGFPGEFPGAFPGDHAWPGVLPGAEEPVPPGGQLDIVPDTAGDV